METTKNIIVFAGPSGVGKSTLSNILLHQSDDFEFSISATTRPIRLGEKNGHDYYFFSKEEFQRRIDNEEFVEWEEVYPGTFYGTLKSEVSRITALDKVAVFDVDVLGALSLKKAFGDQAHVIFIKPESIEALEARLKSRGTESDDEVKTRVARFKTELQHEHDFDDVIVNETGKIDESKQALIEIIKEHFPQTTLS